MGQGKNCKSNSRNYWRYKQECSHRAPGPSNLLEGHRSSGKAHRLNLSAKIKNKSFGENISKNSEHKNLDSKAYIKRRFSKSKFKSLIIEKDFEPENPKQLEELDENSCKWPIGHPNESSFYFCGRKSLKDFSYCKLHLLYAFQPKGKKDELIDKDNEVPKFIEKKIKSA